MSQFYKKSFYFDETRERSIEIEWNRGFKEVYFMDNGEEFHKVEKSRELLDGITITTPKGENLYVRLHKNPARWEVMLGDRYLINAYNFAKDSLKSTSNLFYVIFAFSLLSFGLQFSIAYSELGDIILSPDILLSIDLLVIYAFIIAFFMAGYLLRKGKMIWYYIGSGLYTMDTLLLISGVFGGMEGGGFSINLGFIVRIVIIYYLIKAYKHVENIKKHQKDIAKKTDAELLDI